MISRSGSLLSCSKASSVIDPRGGVKRTIVKVALPARAPTVSSCSSNTSLLPTLPRTLIEVDAPPAPLRFPVQCQPSKPLAQREPMSAQCAQDLDSVLFAKVQQCRVLHDFMDPFADADAKLDKETSLMEFAELVQCSQLRPTLEHALIEMSCANIFTRPTAMQSGGFLLPVEEPAWSHVRLCYEILVWYFARNPDSELITSDVIDQLIACLDTSDFDERDLIVGLVTAYFRTRKLGRARVMRAILDRLALLRDVPLSSYCGHPLLVCLKHCMELCFDEWRREIADIILQGVIPLLTFPYLPAFDPALQATLVQFVCLLPSMVIPVLAQIQQIWPLCIGQRRAICLNLIISIVVHIDQADFQRFGHDFFKLIGDILPGDHSVSILAVLAMFEQPDILDWMRMHMLHVNRCLLEPIAQATGHWGADVRDKADTAFQAIKLLSQTKGRLPKPGGGQKARDSTKKWAMVIGQINPQNTEFDRTQFMAQLEAAFSGAQMERSKFLHGPETVVVSKFMTHVREALSMEAISAPRAHKKLNRRTIRE
jgi:hypothetical protein